MPGDARAFTVRVVAASHAEVVDGRATVKILDDDRAPRIRIVDGHASEGDGTAFTLVALDRPSGRTVTVDYRTHNGSATSGSDFMRTKGMLTFSPGAVWALVQVPLVDDRRSEGTERFTIKLRDAKNAGIADDRARIKIYDDDRG